MERRGPAIEPKEIKQDDDFTVSILWGDDRRCQYGAAELRRACPCAQCVNEWTGERVLKPESISEKMEIKDLSIVGRYALNFRWSDGHETGIYSFRYLRELCESQGCGDSLKRIVMEERDIFNEREEVKKATYSCPHCRERAEYDVRWMKRTKKAQAPRGANEHDRVRFEKSRDYMVRIDDMLACRNARCRRRFEIPTMQSIVYI